MLKIGGFVYQYPVGEGERRLVSLVGDVPGVPVLTRQELLDGARMWQTLHEFMLAGRPGRWQGPQGVTMQQWFDQVNAWNAIPGNDRIENLPT